MMSTSSRHSGHCRYQAGTYIAACRATRANTLGPEDIGLPGSRSSKYGAESMLALFVQQADSCRPMHPYRAHGEVCGIPLDARGRRSVRRRRPDCGLTVPHELVITSRRSGGSSRPGQWGKPRIVSGRQRAAFGHYHVGVLCGGGAAGAGGRCPVSMPAPHQRGVAGWPVRPC
jgi:hypothetical protein